MKTIYVKVYEIKNKVYPLGRWIPEFFNEQMEKFDPYVNFQSYTREQLIDTIKKFFSKDKIIVAD